jgi:hypothetical protein
MIGHRCIADKTLKAFLFSFFWVVILSALMLLPNLDLAIVGKEKHAWIIVRHCGGFCIIFMICRLLVLYRRSTDVSFYDRSLHRAGRRTGIRDLLASFGDTWWKYFITSQPDCTKLAWPGIDWKRDTS